MLHRDASRSEGQEGEEVGDVDEEEVEEELDHSIRHRKRRNLHEKVVANS